MRVVSLASIIVLSWSVSGCGVVAQSVMGWRSADVANESKTKSVRIDADRAGAQVFRRDTDGSESKLGIAPYNDELVYVEARTTRSPQVLGLVLGGIVEIGASVAAFLLGRGQESCFAPNDCYTTREVSTPWLVTGGLFAYLGAQDLIVAYVHGTSEDEVNVATKKGRSSVGYLARVDGATAPVQTVEIPNGATDVHFTFPSITTAALKPVPPPPPKAPRAPPSDWVIAVMAVRDMTSGDTSRAIDAGLLVNVESQLRVFLGQKRYRTIDRGTMRATIEAQIDDAKRQSYESCYDDQCQIELGKALAATHIVRAEIGRFGGVCTLNTELIDLTSEVSVAAASARGDCQEEAFLGMSEAVTHTLESSARR